MKKEDILKAVQDNPDYVLITLNGYLDYVNSASSYDTNYSIKLTLESFTDDVVHYLKNLNKISYPVVKTDDMTEELYLILRKIRYNSYIKNICLESIEFYDGAKEKMYKIDINKLEDNFEIKNSTVVVFNDDDLKNCKYYYDLKTLIKDFYVDAFNKDFILSINYLLNLTFDEGVVLKETSLLGNKVIYKVIINNEFELLSVFNANDNSWVGLTIKKLNQ